MQNDTYFKHFYQDCLKQNITFTYESAYTSVVFVRTTQWVIQNLVRNY